MGFAFIAFLMTLGGIYAALEGRRLKEEEEKFPRLQVKAIAGMGPMPVITWEPWLTDFDAEEDSKPEGARKKEYIKNNPPTAKAITRQLIIWPDSVKPGR